MRFNNLVMQLERAHWRDTLAGCKAIIHQHLDLTLTLMIAGHRIGHYSAEGKLLTPLSKKQIKAVEKTLRGKVPFPLNLQIPHTTRIRTFSPPLRLLIYETGHFTCYQKRTFLLANDTPVKSFNRCFRRKHFRSIRHCRIEKAHEDSYQNLGFDQTSYRKQPKMDVISV